MVCIIIHGSNSKDQENSLKYNLPPQNERHWISWIKQKLEEKGIKCFTPLMPKNWALVYKDWKREFEKIKINEDSILIGHSSGAIFLLRWLGETKQKIRKLILVAPAKTEKGGEFWENFINFDIDYKIKERVNQIVVFISDNDSLTRIKDGKIIAECLDAKLIELKGRGHFIEKHMDTKEFPELLEEVLK